ncbi:ATP-binding protein [Psychrobacter sp. SCQQ22]|uniref:DNA mismatch repair endonuclease MutL n=1 Tax=Psychrobacter sp. SCQQ22 TaxID=2792059 RepID=UPI0018CF09A6|nr:DNA mismatch repair endonuclease MutL [Psychrobacter sp. SCQQ22]MBH0086235.1 ATP-binding protein [Psychrobacter sp. SCQQ22]
MSDNYANTRIKKLSPLLINQLAAGEVVTRPAAVVKELLENAIDAGATNIEVRITQGGMGLIEVVDNGVGIHPDDIVMAITRHATSKVADVANLHGITTLGFRGEALAATAAVSRLTLTSSHDDSGVGRQLQVAGVLADTPKLVPVVHNRGTTITVKDLYFNVPARRGNLKSIATEFGHIETIVREVALARADVSLTLFHDNKKRMSLSSNTLSSNTLSSNTLSSNTLSSTSLSVGSMPSNSVHIDDSTIEVNRNGNENASRLPLSRLEQATGISLIDNAIKITIDLSSLMQQTMDYANNNSFDSQASISGWLWPIHYEQQTKVASALPKLIYVNGRLVKEALINNQLRQLAQSAQLNGMGYALYFDLPTQWLNINVHPSKQRIKISPLNNIMAHLNHAVQSQLKNIEVNEQPAKYDKPLIEDNTLISDERVDIVATDQSYESAVSQNRSRQVNTAKQSYELPASQTIQTMSQSQYSAESELGSNKFTSQRTDISNGVLVGTRTLPICLEVISGLDKLALGNDIAKGVDDKTLPWLLFFHQGQCFLIAETDWQSKLNQLFESQILRSKVLQHDKPIISAREINQQLITMSQQMSTQDLMLFITDIEALLIKNSIKTISSSHLVTLMLLSTTEKILS